MHPGKPARALLGVVLVLSVIGSSSVSAAPPAAASRALYDAIGRDAARGDSRALELKQAIDQYLRRNSLRVEDLGSPIHSNSIENMGGMRLRIEGSPPWSVRVVNDTDLASAAALDSYRQNRHAVLAALAAADPGRRIRAVIAPSRLVDVSSFAAGLTCDCRGVSIIVDVFSSAGWLMASGRPLTRQSIRASGDELEADLLEQAAVSLDQFSAADTKGIHVTVRRIEVDVPAGEALKLAALANVLMVDTTTDLADAYRNVAATIQVGPGPDVFAAYAEFRLGNPIVPGPQPGKVR
jgi:hypothetical protein